MLVRTRTVGPRIRRRAETGSPTNVREWPRSAGLDGKGRSSSLVPDHLVGSVRLEVEFELGKHGAQVVVLGACLRVHLLEPRPGYFDRGSQSRQNLGDELGSFV